MIIQKISTTLMEKRRVYLESAAQNTSETPFFSWEVERKRKSTLLPDYFSNAVSSSINIFFIRFRYKIGNTSILRLACSAETGRNIDLQENK